MLTPEQFSKVSQRLLDVCSRELNLSFGDASVVLLSVSLQMIFSQSETMADLEMEIKNCEKSIRPVALAAFENNRANHSPLQ